MFVGIGFMILQTVLSKIQNPKKKYASLDDRELFHTNTLNKRLAILCHVLGFTTPLPFALFLGTAKSIPHDTYDILISVLIVAILVAVSTGVHFWHLSGISKAEIEYRKFEKQTANQRLEPTPDGAAHP